MPQLTINGRPIDVADGTTILQAAAQLDIDIPVFCYHEGLSVAANCRMCLVEVEGAPKPLPACEVLVRDGMVVHTESELALTARKTTLEFILINHPVDCPICDCAGECVLQDHYFHHSAQPSRINVRKVHKAKRVPIGPTVILDKERCINCTRCVRFCAEVSGTNQLVQTRRSDRTEISVFPGQDFTDPYSLCTVDLCPVGALTSRDFRFKKRVWWLKSAPSVCPECARGCSVHVDFADGRVYRVRPRPNPSVNHWWACDQGRLAYHEQQENRITDTLTGIRTDEERRAAPVEATTRVLAGWRDLVRSNRRVALVLAAGASLEDGYAVFQLARSLDVQQVFLGSRAPVAPDNILRVADPDANRRGLARLAEAFDLQLPAASTLFATAEPWAAIGLFGTEFTLPAPVDPENVGPVSAFSWRHNDNSRIAHTLVPIPSHYEQAGHFVNVDGVVQRAAAAVPPPAGVVPLHRLLHKASAAAGFALELGTTAQLAAAALSRAGLEVNDG